MENLRKSKIQKYFDEIVVDKANLNQLMDRIINKVFSCVQSTSRTDTNLTYKDLVKIQNYELKFLQKLGELTYELESLEEECPFEELNIEESSYSNEPIPIAASIEESVPQVDEQVTEQINTADIREQPTHDYEISETELNNIRQTLQLFSSKLGINLQTFSSMSNYYAKQSRSSNIAVIDNQMPSSSTVIHNESNPSYLDTDQIPEKDINPNIKTEEENIIIEQTDASNTATDSKGDLNLIGAQVQNFEDESDLNVKIPNNVISTVTNLNATCTALEKVNNLKLTDQKMDIKPLELPDLTLVPIINKKFTVSDVQNTVIRNFQTQSKKKNNNLEQSAYFDLKAKDAPKVGTMCMLSHIETPTHFYIHLVDTESTVIDKISENIKKCAHSWSRYKSKDEARQDINKYGVVYIPTFSTWYRMEVLNWYDGCKHANVFVRLVDYGSTHIISYTHLGKLTEDLACIPMLAIQCNFPMMYPPNSTSSNRLTQWPQDSVNAFMELSGLVSYDSTFENMFKIIYAHWDEEQKSVSVDFYNVSNGDEENTVGQILLNLGLAIQIIDGDEGEPELEEFLQDVGSLEEADNINEAIVGYDARDEARICRFTKSDGTCYKGKNCKLEHIHLPEDGFTTDNEIVFREAMYSLLLPRLGEIITVLITGYKDMCNFSVQLIRIPYTDKAYIVDRDFHVLMKTINSLKLLMTYEYFKVAPAVGEIVLFKHWSNQWLRGVVRDFSTNADGVPFEFQIHAVDYGESQKVAFKDLRKIKPDYLQLPFQAVECYIDEYKYKKECLTNCAKEFFDQNLYFHNFLATTMSSSLPLKIKLRSMDGTINIGSSLYEKGFAERRTQDSHPSDDCGMNLY